MRSTSILFAVGLAALAVAWGFLLPTGVGAVFALLALGAIGGFVLRSWRAAPLLTIGVLLGSVLRIVGDAGWYAFGPPYGGAKLRLLGEGVIGLSMGLIPLTMMLCVPVGAGKWIGGLVERGAGRPLT